MGELGAGAGTGYPAALDTRQSFSNVGSPDPDGATRMDQEVLNDVLKALVALETELGIDPAGSDTDVVTRLAAIDASIADKTVAPQGRLTLTTALPVLVANAADQTTIFYTPYLGDLIPLFNGTVWTNTTFAELSIVMAADADFTADSNFDLFVFNDSGTIRLVTGAAWTNGTTRAEAIARQNGILTNGVEITGRFSATETVTVPVNRGTYVGTMRTTGTAGTTTMEFGGSAAGGTEGLFFVWNMYNRVKMVAVVRDSTDFWTYATATWRAANASNAMRVTFIRGVNEDFMSAQYMSIANPAAPTNEDCSSGVALDATNVGGLFMARTFAGGADSTSIIVTGTALNFGYPGIGLHFYQGTEITVQGSIAFYGDNAGANVQSGLIVEGLF